MSTEAPAVATGVRRLATPHPSRAVATTLVVATVLALLVALVVLAPTIRNAEASMAWLVVQSFTSAGVSGPTLFVELGTSHALGLHVTAECSVSILFVPSLVALVALTALRSTVIARAVESTVLALVLILAINLARIVGIAAAYTLWGHDGFWVAHVIVGTLISVLAVVAGLLVQLRGTLSGERRGSRTY